MTSMEELFNKMGVDIGDDMMESVESSEGIVSNLSVQQANKRLSPIKTDFAASHIVLYPFWMSLTFHPYTLKKLPKGKAFPSYNMGMTPSEIVGMFAQACTPTEEELASEEAEEVITKKAEYKAELYKLLKITDPNFELTIDPNTGSCTPAVFDVFSPFLNNYNIQETTQRYKLSAEKSITRKAILATLPNGMINEAASDQVLINAFACETALLTAEVQKLTDEETKKETPKKQIETSVSTIRGDRVVSRPYVTSVVLCMAIPASTSSVISDDDKKKYSQEQFNLKYLLCYDKTNDALLGKLQGIKERVAFTNLNYLIIQRNVPEKSDTVPNLGVATQLTEYISTSTKVTIGEQITEFDRRFTEAMRDSEFIDPEKFKSSVSKFGPISLEEVMRCYTNNITQYKRALADETIVRSNQSYLSSISENLGAAYVKGKKVIDAEITSELVKDVRQDAEMIDTEDEEAMGIAAKATAEDFI